MLFDRDLETYKQLLTLFPEGKMISQGPWDTEWMFYPKQQQCAIDIMDQMEFNGQLHLLIARFITVVDKLLWINQSIKSSQINTFINSSKEKKEKKYHC